MGFVSDYWLHESERLEERVRELGRSLSAATARAEAAERLAVWAAKNPHSVVEMIECATIDDLTDADLLRDLKARSGVE